MHPELVENPTFLRYYERWQTNPSSVVFAAIAEMFLKYGLTEDAIKIAKEGLIYHPNLVSGRLALAKAYLANGDVSAAYEEAQMISGLMPENAVAAELALLTSKTIPAGRQANSATTNSAKQALPLQTDDEDITEEMLVSDVEDEVSVADDEEWCTVTMARILASQGHYDKARIIYKKILEKEPEKKIAKKELELLR